MKRKIKGYFSVEASLLFPFLLLVQIIFVYMAVYVYDRCVMEQCAYEAAFRGTANILHNTEEVCKASSQAADYVLTDRLLLAGDVKKDVKVTAKDITVTYGCNVAVPFLTWMSEISNNKDYTIKVSKTVPRINQVNIIRISEFGKEIGNSGSEM